MIILKVTKNQGVTLSLEDTVFEKLQGVGQIDPPPPPPFLAILGLRISLVTMTKSIGTCCFSTFIKEIFHVKLHFCAVWA